MRTPSLEKNKYTAKTEENSLVNGLSLGADDYISKPFGVMELRDVYKRQEQSIGKKSGKYR